MKLILSIIFTLFVSSAVGEVIRHFECKDVDVAPKCQIHEVRIDPCPQAADDMANPCQIKRGRSATVEFDYTAGFNATSGKGEIFWISAEGDMPYIGMDQNACSFTQCPVNENARRTYSQKFQTMRKHPARSYDLRWKLSNLENAEEFCCFIIKIRLTK